MVLRDGKPWMSFGTPGGEQQDQWQPIMLTRMVDHRFGIQQAIDLPSFHSEHWISSFWPRGAKPGKLVLEGRYAPDVLEALLARGHQAEMGGEWSEGRLTGARLEAGRADLRRRQSARHAGLRGRALRPPVAARHPAAGALATGCAQLQSPAGADPRHGAAAHPGHGRKPRRRAAGNRVRQHALADAVLARS